MRIALIGDIHTHFDAVDVDYFNRSDVDLLLLVGDLPGRSHRQLLTVARRLAQLTPSALMVPGNHDGTTPLQLAAEISYARWLRRPLGRGMAERMSRLQAALAPVTLGGYSCHHYQAAGVELSVVVGRPHAMDQQALSFQPWLAERYGVHSQADSVAKLQAAVDQAGERVIFLAHNGVAGLGPRRSDLWGGLPLRPLRDNGDHDLAAAVAYAQRSGRHVLAVVAGHMHHSGDSGSRRWWLRRDEVLYINAARVPRIYLHRRRWWRHHLRLITTGDHAIVEEVRVYGGGEDVVRWE